MADTLDDTVKRFDAKSGAFEEEFVSEGSGGLNGPRGLVFGRYGALLVANQNVERLYAGEVLRYDGKTGASEGAVVPYADDKAPFAPRGIVQRAGNLYVADMGDPSHVLRGCKAPNPSPGRVAIYDERTGLWLKDIAYPGFQQTCSDQECVQWSPRALVFGPDGALYVSLMKFVFTLDEKGEVSSDCPSGALPGFAQDSNALPGRVVRIEAGDHVEVFVDGECDGSGLARPEGLVFGPSGKLYVTSFRVSEKDTDKILVFRGKTGEYLDKIDLDVVGQPRAYAQALLFGPRGDLFVPIAGEPATPDLGSVRRYNVRTKQYEVFIPPGGALGAGWYLTFGRTNPATLAYEGH